MCEAFQKTLGIIDLNETEKGYSQSEEVLSFIRPQSNKMSSKRAFSTAAMLRGASTQLTLL